MLYIRKGQGGANKIQYMDGGCHYMLFTLRLHRASNYCYSSSSAKSNSTNYFFSCTGFTAVVESLSLSLSPFYSIADQLPTS
jgi:hypothetical protein